MIHRVKRRTYIALALLAPGLLLGQSPKAGSVPEKAGATKAQSVHIFLKFASRYDKHRGTLSNVGLMGGQPVFRTAQGEFFTVDPATGDLRFLDAQGLGFIKIKSEVKAAPPSGARMGAFIKFDGIKGEAKVSIAGVDAQGRVVMENARGERFVLGPTGDMQFLK